MYKNLWCKRIVLSCLLLPAAVGLAQHSDRSLPASSATFQPVLDTMFRTNSTKVQYNYVMTGRVRLVLFWVGADDVGGGYIRRDYSTSDPDMRITQVLFGSDPAKAPRKINHWGAGTEALTSESSTIFMGFMTSAKTNSAAEAEGELKAKEERGQYPFQAIVSVVDKDRALSRSIALSSDRNFNLHEYDAARRLVAERLKTNGTSRELAGAKRKCRDSRGFLQATDELIGRVLNGSKAPQSICYIHNARNYTLTLEEHSKVKRKSVRISHKDGTKLEKEYRDLIRAHFSVLNHESEERSTFGLLLGTVGELRGVPVQIVHQPNWWFEAELNLESTSSEVQAN